MKDALKRNADSLEARIFRAARELFERKGYFDTTTREIAELAGTSESGVYRKYPSKYHLLIAVYNHAWGVFNKAIGEEKHDDPRKEIVRIFLVLADLYERDKLTITFMLINIGNTDTLLVERKQEAIISTENLKYIDQIHSLCKRAVLRQLVSSAYTINSLTEVILGIYEGTLLGWYLADNSKQYQNRVSAKEMVEALNYILSIKFK